MKTPPGIVGGVPLLSVVLASVALAPLRSWGSDGLSQQPAEPRGRIRGVVLNSATGQPIAGAYVAIDHSGDAGGSNLARFREQGIYVTTETDKDGRFVLTGVAFHDSHPFMATHPGFVRRQQTLSLSTVEPDIDIQVLLKPAATVVVKVVDAEGKPVQEETTLRLEAEDKRVFLPMRADWPDLPYRNETTTTGTFSFGELDTGVFSVEAMRSRPNETVYHGKISDTAVKAGETKEVLLKPAPHRSVVKIKVEEDPYREHKEMWAALMVCGKPGLLAWAGRNFHHPEDERLGRIWKNAGIMASLVSPNDTYTLRNLPPGKYAVFAFTMGMYKDWKSPAVYLRGTQAEISSGTEQTLQIPFVEPDGPSPIGSRLFYNTVELEEKEYTAQEIREILISATGAKAEDLVVDPSIRDGKVALHRAKLAIWDLLEQIYLEKGWRLEGDFKARKLIFRPSEG